MTTDTLMDADSPINPVPPLNETLNGNQSHERLAMHKMALTDFKSYAGRIEIGPFHSSFTSIVGPNGSGKSNVIDALLFVFGFKAKKMRQEKLSGLIHESRDHHAQQCMVEIYFHSIVEDAVTGECHVQPDSQLIVARTATRQNKSFYSINGKSSSYTEVTQLLRDRGVDLDHKRFLILQGEVESISQMKPKALNEHEEGLLEYLEDIIGTAQYKPAIQEAFEALEKVGEERADRLNRVKMVENQMNALESQKEEAESYLKEENTLLLCKAQLYQWKERECGRVLEKVQTEMDTAKENWDVHTHSVQEQTEAWESLREQVQTLSREHDLLKKEAGSATAALSAYERQYIQMEETKKHLKGKLKKAAKAIEKEQHARSEAELWLKNYDGDVAKKQKELETLKSSLATAEQEMATIREGLRGKTDKFQAALDSKKQELAPWMEKINAALSEINVKENQLKMVQDRMNADTNALADLQVVLEQEQSIVLAKRKEIKTLTQQLSKAKEQVESLKMTLDTLSEQETRLRTTLIEVNQEREAVESALHADQGRDELIKVLLKEKKSGRLPGFFGRLGELGELDARYDVAISSAFFESLKWIVVDTVKTAEQCLSLLKAKNLGRASFIVLERTTAAKDQVATPEQVPRLVDLVRPREPRFRQAFYYVLRDTLVAEDLDQANRIAFGAVRWKVVTLDGKVIDKAGTMSGGGHRVQRGGMRGFSASEFTEEDLARVIQRKDQLEVELRACREERKFGEAKLTEATAEVPTLEDQLACVQMDVGIAEKQIENITKKLGEVKTNPAKDTSADASQIKTLEKDIRTLKQQEEKLRASMEPIHAEIKVLQDKILEVGGDKLRRQNARIQDVEDQIRSMQDLISSLETQKASTKKTFDKFEKSFAKNQEEISEIEKELAQLNEQGEERMSKAAEVQEASKNAEKIAMEKKAILDETKEALDKASTKVNKLRQKNVDLENAFNDVKKRFVELKKETQYWKLLLSELREQQEEGMFATLNEEALDAINPKALENEVAVLEEKLAAAKPNLEVLEEYKRQHADYVSKTKDLDTVTATRDEIKAKYDSLRQRRLDEFMKGFTMISQKLKEMYQMITLGGNAELELVDSLDPFSEGILFSVMPPKKSWKAISNLSGGEKTLSSLALVFALHHFKPTPLYVMDEIDAALDFRNVSIIANYIKERTKNAQFIIISLRNNMFELADRLVGIYKTNNCTKSIAINPNSVEVPVPSH